MKTNEIKKGMVVKLRNGWYGIMADNMRGNTRMVDVDGFEREIGSVYSHDITGVRTNDTRQLGASLVNLRLTELLFEPVEHTPAQINLKKQVDIYFTP
jgi:hypothetical protein